MPSIKSGERLYQLLPIATAHIAWVLLSVDKRSNPTADDLKSYDQRAALALQTELENGSTFPSFSHDRKNL